MCSEPANQATFPGATQHVPTVLILTNISLVAAKIARCIAIGYDSNCSNNSIRSNQSQSKRLSILEFQGLYMNQLVNFRLLIGLPQLQKITFSSSFQQWSEGNQFKPFTTGVEWKESLQTSAIINDLLAEVKSASNFIFWFDVNSEAEFNCFQIIDIIASRLKINCEMLFERIHRPYFSFYSESEIKAALSYLKRPLQTEALAVSFYQEINFRVKTAFNHAVNTYIKPYNHVVQMMNKPCLIDSNVAPILASCVEQFQKKTANDLFQIKKLHVIVQVFSPNNQLFELTRETSTSFTLPRIDDSLDVKDKFEEELEELQQSMIGSFAAVRQVQTTIVTKETLKPINFSALLKLASSELKMAPKDTLTNALHLYYEGFITYPKSEATSYPENYDFNPIWSELKTNQHFASLVQFVVDHPNRLKPNTKFSRLDTHPAIMPVRIAQQSNLVPKQWDLYNLICSHFLLSFLPSLEYKKTEIKFLIDEESFVWQNEQVDSSQFEDNLVPKCLIRKTDVILDKLPNVGDFWSTGEVKIDSVNEIEINCFLESELIDLIKNQSLCLRMLNIPNTLQSMVDSDLIEITEDRRYVPKKLAIEIVNFFKQHSPELIQTDIRVDFEKACEQIQYNASSYRSLLKDMTKSYQKLFDQLESNWNTTKNNQISCVPFPIQLSSDDIQKIYLRKSNPYLTKVEIANIKYRNLHNKLRDPRLRSK